MAAALVQSNKGLATTATVNPSFLAATTAGNIIVLSFAADDYNGTPGAGWNQSTGMEQQVFHGAYIWWRVSAGETSFQYIIGSATNSAWVLSEWSGLDASPYDISAGSANNTSALTATSPNLTPSAGDRLIIAAFGASLASGGIPAASGWTNSFTQIQAQASGSGSGTFDANAQAYRTVTANGSTAYSTGVTYAPTTPQSHSGLMIAFKVGATFTATGSKVGDSTVGSGTVAVASVTDTTPPGTINVTTVTATKISRVVGKDSTDVTFTADEAFVEYEIRRGATGGRATGTQVETATVASRTSHTTTITDDEIVAAGAPEGSATYYVFVKDAAGNWST